MQRSPVVAGCDLSIGFPCLLERLLSGQRDDTVERGVIPAQPRQVDVGEALRGELAGLKPRAELRNASESDVLIGRRQWSWSER